MRLFYCFLLSLAFAASGAAQTSGQRTTEVTGTVVDATDGQPLPGATVLLVRATADSTHVGAASGVDGAFRLAVAPGDYVLRISFVGYTALERELTARGRRLELGALELAVDDGALAGVDVEAVRQRVEVRGDTTAFNADAYAVNPDATVQDLVQKLPGVTVENGTVTAEGETVQRVLVDGREFFGTDVQAALQNLPAELVKEIQVFDRQSDESRFSGFDDGNAEKTINIITRAGMQNGQFGRAYAGAGPEGEYLAGGNTTFLNGDRRLTIVGIANNVDQQNFATEDLAGVASSGGRGGRGRGGRGGGGGGGDVGNLLLGDSDGIASATALGLSYADLLAGGKLRLTGSAFFNTTATLLDASLNRATLSRDNTFSQLYDETDNADTDNTNYRASFRAQYDLSERTQIVFEPRLTVQDYGSVGNLLGLTSLPSGESLAETSAFTKASSLALSGQGELQIRHRFAARGRTLSLSLDGDVNDQGGETIQTTSVTGFGGQFEDSLQDQLFDTDALTRSVSARLSFTEPIGESGQFQVSYRPQISRSTSDQLAFLADASGGYTVADETFTSVFEQQSLVQRGGASYRYGTREVNGQIGVDLQHERLEGEQAAPEAFIVDRSFWSVLPSARMRVSLGEGSRVSLDYRARTQTPSANQLRSLVNNSNPLLLTTGNPELDPSTTHTVRARFNATDAAGGSVLYGYVSGAYGQDYISSATTLARAETTTASGVVIPAGGQLTLPANVDGYWNGRSLLSYGRPVGLIRSNVNLSVGASYTRAPGLVNDALNVSDQLGLDGRVFIGSSISPAVDFSLEYGARYAATTNSDAPTLDDTTVRHLAGGKLAWLPWEGISFATNLQGLHYTGLDASVDPTQILWGAKLGYKFLPGNPAEVSLSIADILDQQRDVERTVTELYIEDAQSRALGRYVMLNLTYKIRDFGQGASGGDREERGRGGDGPPRGRRGGGFGE